MSSTTRIFDLLDHIESAYGSRVFIEGKRNGKWNSYTAKLFKESVDDLSRGLLASGIQRNDKVAIMSHNRPEWNIADFAIMQIGATQVPMYPTLAGQDIRFILKDAEVRVVFVGDLELYQKLDAIRQETGSALKIYCFDDLEGIPSWKEILDLGKSNTAIDLQPFRDSVGPEDLLTLIYTSGTTGTPKGVMLTHNNLLSNVLASCLLYPPSFKRALSFLPLSHIFERMVLYMYIHLGISVHYAESMETIVADLNEVKPDGFTTVPRLLEKVYDRIVAKGSELTGLKKKIFYWALELGLQYERNGKNGWWYERQLAIARKLVFSKWQEALGGNIQALVSGGAALQPRLARVFWAAGIPVLEGYGLTETSPVIAVNGLGPDQTMFTTVGKPLTGVTVKIAEDGEILCKGPNVMKGYYNRPDATAESIDEEGFFHTGDIGELLDGIYLRITDRKKEIFKTAGGKYVAPQVLENKYKESPLIEQVMVLGENRKFPSALIVPAADALKEWCLKKGIPYSNKVDILNEPAVIDKYQRVLDQYNQDFGRWEQVKKFVLLPKEWSIEGGELTPKLSFRRKVILEKYKLEIDRMYANAEAEQHA